MQDLTHPIESGMPVYPSDPEVAICAADTFEEDDCRVMELSLGSHAGTHVDAPSHTEGDGATLGDYSVSAFVRDAVVADCTDLGAREAIPAARVLESDADCVLFRTGWDRHWGTERYRDHPYLSVAAAERCVEAGYAVGVDAFSPDPTPPVDGDGDAPAGRDAFAAHHALLGAGLLVFENLTNLHAVPERFELRALPISLDGDGAPVRAVGVNDA